MRRTDICKNKRRSEFVKRMPARLLLHIGINKTGTSAIQRALNHNRDALNRFALLYPRTGIFGAAHHRFSRLLGFGPDLDLNPSERKRELSKLKESLQAEMCESEASEVVISSENFMLPRSLGAVKGYFSFLDVCVVVYLRRHDEWRMSAYSQGLRMVANPPWSAGFEGWLRFQEQRHPKYGDYRFLVDSWAEKFGRESIRVRPYEAQQYAPDIVTDFMRAVGRPEVMDTLRVEPQRVNEALSRRGLLFLEAIQRMKLDAGTRSRLVQHAASMGRDERRQPMASPATRRRLVEDNLADYEYIAREYMGREDGILFREEYPDTNEDWEPPAPLTQGAVVKEIEWALRSEAAVRGVDG